MFQSNFYYVNDLVLIYVVFHSNIVVANAW